MILDCKLNEIDNIQSTWPTDGSGLEGDSKLDVGDFGIARRDPFKYFDNPKLRELLTKEYVEEKPYGWDIDERVCVINAIQLTETIKAIEVSPRGYKGLMYKCFICGTMVSQDIKYRTADKTKYSLWCGM